MTARPFLLGVDILGLVLALAAFAVSVLYDAETGAGITWFDNTTAFVFADGLAIGFVVLIGLGRRLEAGPPTVPDLAWVPLALLICAGAGAMVLLHDAPEATGGAGLAAFVASITILAWRALALLAQPRHPRWVRYGVVAGLFGVALLWSWEVIVVGLNVPAALLPPPSSVGSEIAANPDVLFSDLGITFLEEVLPGFLIGTLAGFLFALAVDAVPFLARGLLPLGNAFAAIPIVGVAPIMIVWFESGPESKIAVVVLMTFFPMLVNTISGLNSVDRMQYDLMRSYGASYAVRLVKLRLPTALPFIFNALKINATLSMIGAIVAEFFGSPLGGMGFRIIERIGRLELDMVWATIAMAALVGSCFYGLWALLERVFTFWHPAMRRP